MTQRKQRSKYGRHVSTRKLKDKSAFGEAFALNDTFKFSARVEGRLLGAIRFTLNPTSFMKTFVTRGPPEIVAPIF